MTCIGPRVPLDAKGRVYFDTGFFCTLFNFNHPFCRFLDRLYGALVVAFRSVFGTEPGAAVDTAGLVKALFKYWVNVALEDSGGVYVNIVDVCNSAPTTEPDEITYVDVFDFIAGRNAHILAKIFAWWMWETSFRVCDCSKIPTPVTPATMPPPPPPNTPVVPPNCSFSWDNSANQKLAQFLEDLKYKLQTSAEYFAWRLQTAYQNGYTVIVDDRRSIDILSYDWPCVRSPGVRISPTNFTQCTNVWRILTLGRTDGHPATTWAVQLLDITYAMYYSGVISCTPNSNPRAPFAPPPPLPADFCALFPEYCECFTTPYSLALPVGCGSLLVPGPRVYDLPDANGGNCPSRAYSLAIAQGCDPPATTIYELPDL